MKDIKTIFRPAVIVGIVGIASFVWLYFSIYVYTEWVIRQSLQLGYGNQPALIGDAFGGIIGPAVAFIGVIVTFLAFYIQYEANKVQRDALNSEQFESKFFELLRMHRENVARINYSSQEGADALKVMSLELQDCYEKIRKIQLRTDEGLLSEQELLDICFHYFYSGTSPYARNYISNLVNPNNDQEKSSLLREIHNDLNTWVKDEGEPVLSDQESKLEAYINHIFHIMTFLHNQSGQLKDSDEPFFTQTVTSQLTSHEIVILLYYSMSEKGKAWLSPNNFVKKFQLVEKMKESPIGLKKKTITDLNKQYG